MFTRYKYKKLNWIDLESPSNDEIKKIMQEHNIHPEVAEEMLSPSLKPKVELYKDFIYLILHFPTIKHTHRTQKVQEVNFVIGKNFLITTRYDTIDAIHKFSKVFEVNTILNKSLIGNHAGFLFYFLVKKLYKSLVHELEYMESNLNKIESHIFEGKERLMVSAISEASRELIDFKRAVTYHEEVLNELELAGTQLFGKDFVFYLRTVVAEYKRVMDMLRNSREFLSELRETNNSLLTTKQNEVMKVLTIMAFVTFPLSLIASIFGMNTLHNPIIGLPGDFWIVITIMITLTTIFFAFFKRKNWL
jgi:magnesium transporter